MDTSPSIDMGDLQLNASQTKCMDELKALIAATPELCDYKWYKEDHTLFRFLSARSWIVEETLEMLKADYKWRQENNADQLIESFEKHPKCKEFLAYWPGGWHGVDKDGSPVFWERIGSLYPKELLDKYSPEFFQFYHSSSMELGVQMRRELSIKAKKAHTASIVVQDIAGLSWRHFYTPGLEIIKEGASWDEAHYPETLKTVSL